MLLILIGQGILFILIGQNRLQLGLRQGLELSICFLLNELLLKLWSLYLLYLLWLLLLFLLLLLLLLLVSKSLGDGRPLASLLGCGRLERRGLIGSVTIGGSCKEKIAQ